MDQQHAQVIRLSRHLGQFWTAANMLSLSRAVLVVPITYLILVDGSKAWLIGLVILAALTDWFDGRLARWSHTVSDWGKVLDPIADKFAAAAILLALVIRGIIPIWFLAFILARDALLVLGAVLITRRTGQVVMSLWWGKVAVGALGVTVLAALLEADPPVLQFCIWGTTALMLYALARYTARFVQIWRTGRLPDEAGPDADVASVQPEG